MDNNEELLPIELKITDATRIYAKRLGIFFLIVLLNFAILAFGALFGMLNETTVRSLAQIFSITGYLLLLIGVSVMLWNGAKLAGEFVLGPPPGPFAIFFLLVISIIRTKLGFLGFACFLLGVAVLSRLR